MPFPDNVPVGILVTDRKLRVKFWNSACETTLGVTSGTICHQNLLNHFPYASSFGFDKWLIEVLDTGNPVMLKGIQIPIHYITGEKFCLNLKINPLRNSENEITGLLVAVEDITDQKLAEKALEQSEERYRTLIEFIPDAIMVHQNGRILFANASAAKLFEVSRNDDLMGKSLMQYIHPDYVEAMMEIISYMQDSIITTPLMEQKIITQKGNTVNVEIASATLPYHDNLAVLVVMRNISERIRTEILLMEIEEKTRELNHTLEMEKLKTEFFANLSHELRTPLNVILSSVQMSVLLLKKGDSVIDTERLGKYVGIIQQNCYRLLRLINNLIDITKIDTGFFNINKHNCNIVRIVEDVSLSVADYIENKGLSLMFDTNIEEKFIACDPDKIERIVLNLLSNAVKFTEPGGHIEVKFEDKGESVIISVKDNGIGIPDDKLEYIFERFCQVNKSLTRNQEGSGIGLSLVKSLVEMHNGSIQVISELGKGAEFIIELPSLVLSEDLPVTSSPNLSSDVIQRINIEFSDIYSCNNR